jgi:hypothetical protein
MSVSATNDRDVPRHTGLVESGFGRDQLDRNRTRHPVDHTVSRFTIALADLPMEPRVCRKAWPCTPPRAALRG